MLRPRFFEIKKEETTREYIPGDLEFLNAKPFLSVQEDQ